MMSDAKVANAKGIMEGRTVDRDLQITVDAVVVGLGAGGAVALRALARAGVSVLGLEAGPAHSTSLFTQREDEMLPRLFWEGGGRATQDLAIRVLQGRGVGGSTVHNTNLCKRTPPPILELWKTKYGVSGASEAEMAKAFETIERDLGVVEIPEDRVNANNRALLRGAEVLGWKAARLKHNRLGCQGSGFCELGCAYNAKQNASKVLVPQALDAGATVYADARVERILTQAGRVRGVEAMFVDGSGNATRRLRVQCKVVVLAASATASAALAKVSGIPDPYGRLGVGLRLHPGAVVAGRFAERIDGHHGIPQSVECTEHLSYEEGSPKRTWIIPAFAHPIGTASTLPGFGADHMRQMRAYRHLAVLTAMLHDESSGSVDVAESGKPILRYEMNEGDRRALGQGLIACAKLLFAAGALEVTIPAIPPRALKSVKDLEGLDLSFVRPHGLPLTAVHPMGTLAMGDDPKKSAVSSQGEHHHVKGLFVADGSLFPTSLGGPPQISIYGFAEHLSPHYVARARAT